MLRVIVFITSFSREERAQCLKYSVVVLTVKCVVRRCGVVCVLPAPVWVSMCVPCCSGVRG